MKLRQAGITLLEVLIGLSITAVGGFLLLGLLTSSSDLFMDQTIQVNHGLSSNQARLEVADLIKSSAGVVGQYPPSGTPQFVTGNNILVLKLPAISASGQVIENVFDYAVVAKYPLDSKLLRKRIFPNGLSSRKSEDKILSSSLESFNVSYLDSNNNPVSPSQSVRITFTINLSGGSEMSENEDSSSSTVNLKNL